MFRKDAFNQLGCWQDYTNRMVYVKQLTIPLVLEKGVTILANITTQIKLQPKYIPKSYQKKPGFQSKAMISVDLFDKYSVFCPLVPHF